MAQSNKKVAKMAVTFAEYEHSDDPTNDPFAVPRWGSPVAGPMGGDGWGRIKIHHPKQFDFDPDIFRTWLGFFTNQNQTYLIWICVLLVQQKQAVYY